MTDFAKTRAKLLSASLLVGLTAFSFPRAADASSEFPAGLKTALEAYFPGQTYCVPLCTACHNTTKGGPQDLNKFGKNWENHGLLPINANVGKLPDELRTYLTTAPGPNDPQVNGKWDSDGDGVSDEDELKDFSSPALSGPVAFCTDLTYGCGARIALAPPPIDKVGLFSAGLVVLGLTLLRRRRRQAPLK
jgi:hypothetical protein